jgi:hypothetical protein
MTDDELKRERLLAAYGARCVRPGCDHAFASHVPELRPGYRACAEGTCVCDDLVKPLHLTQTGPAARMPLGRPGSAGLLSDPPGGESTQLCPHPTSTHTVDHQWAPGGSRCGCGALGPTEAIRAARERYLAESPAPDRFTSGRQRSHLLARPRRPEPAAHVPVAEMVIYQHAEGAGKRAALNVAYIEAAAAGVHIHEYGPGGLARSDNCPRGCQP